MMTIVDRIDRSIFNSLKAVEDLMKEEELT